MSTIKVDSIEPTDPANPLEISTSGGTDADVTVDTSGAMFIGTTSVPVNGSGGAAFRADSNNRKNLYLSTSSSFNQGLIVFDNPNGAVGSITVSGSATSYNTSSDYRLKTDAQPMTGASDRVQALKPVNFEWLSDGTRVDGFLAHELQAVVPEAATGTKDAVDEDGNPEYQGIDQSKLVPLLTAALQEALTKIDSLEARLDSLELAK